MTTTTPTPPPGEMVPSALERRQIFHMLQRISSYTAWKRILGYYKAWAEVTEQSVREASDKGLKTSIPNSDYVDILKGLAHFEEGVDRLGRGDKRVFKYDANGEFVMAGRISSYWQKLFDKVETGDNILHSTTPLLAEFKAALDLMSEAVFECSPDIIEKRYLDSDSNTYINDWLRDRLARMTFPNPLPEVPEPKEVQLIATGQYTPCSGIWEPVDAPSPKGGLMGIFGKKAPPPSGPLKMTGTMAYLHGGSNAPPMASYGKPDGEPATWRLLWRDDRYEDGTIPEEEKDYVFLEPQPPKPKKPTPVYRPVNFVVSESGKKAPVAGRWLVQGELFASVQVQAGEELPLHNGRPVRWVLSG